MMFTKKILHLGVLILLFASTHTLFGQNCYNFHSQKICVSKLEKDFRLYGQSESALLVIDSTSKLPVIFYGNKDYIITVCTERGYYPVHFILRDIEANQVLYDNMEDDYIESIGLTFDEPTKVIIEVTLLALNIEPAAFGEDDACVGVHIQWRRAIKTGF